MDYVTPVNNGFRVNNTLQPLTYSVPNYSVQVRPPIEEGRRRRSVNTENYLLIKSRVIVIGETDDYAKDGGSGLRFLQFLPRFCALLS